MKEGFFANNQQTYSNSGQNYNQALDQWRISEQMGATLPQFGQGLNQNIGAGVPINPYSQPSQFQSNNLEQNFVNQYGFQPNNQNNQNTPYQAQQLANQFVAQQNFQQIQPNQPIQPYQPNQQQIITPNVNIDPILMQQQQLNQMIQMQNQIIAQHQAN